MAITDLIIKGESKAALEQLVTELEGIDKMEGFRQGFIVNLSRFNSLHHNYLKGALDFDLYYKKTTEITASTIELLDALKKQHLGKHLNQYNGEFTPYVDERDGEVYKTCKIKDKIWLAEPLKFNTNNKRCYPYENNPDLSKIHGMLYSWEEAMKACPPGWWIPTTEDWKDLCLFAGGYRKWVYFLKVGNPFESYANIVAKSKWGFSIKLSGWRLEGRFQDLNEGAFFWSSSNIAYLADYVAMHEGEVTIVAAGGILKSNGLSCICVKKI